MPVISISFGSKLLQGREHQLLLAQRARIFDADFFGKAQQLGGGLELEVLELHFGHEPLHSSHGVRWERGSPVARKVGNCERMAG